MGGERKSQSCPLSPPPPGSRLNLNPEGQVGSDDTRRDLSKQRRKLSIKDEGKSTSYNEHTCKALPTIG